MNKRKIFPFSGDDAERKEAQEFPRLEMAAGSMPSIKHPEKNEDRCCISSQKGVAAVFDGVGGSPDGEVAAILAEEAVKNLFKDDSIIAALTDEKAEALVSKALKKANKKVFARNIRRSLGRYMQTTGLVGLFWTDKDGGEKFTFGNVGDSRACLYRDGELKQLTLDDGLISESRTEEEAWSLQLRLSNVTDLEELSEEHKSLFASRNKLANALGGYNEIQSFIDTIPVQKGDRILFASDGVTDNLTHDEIERILSTYPNNEQAVRELIGNAFQRSKSFIHPRAKPDDITAVIVQVGEGQAERLYPSPEEVTDPFSWYNMKKDLREGGRYIDVSILQAREGEEWHITEADQFKNVVVLTDSRNSRDSNDFVHKKVTREELKEMVNSDVSFAKEGNATVVFASEEEVAKSS